MGAMHSLSGVPVQLDYAWDEPMAVHRLRVVMDTDGTYKDVGAHEYNLDVIKVQPVCSACAVTGSRRHHAAGQHAPRALLAGLTQGMLQAHPVVKLRRANVKMVHKVAK